VYAARPLVALLFTVFLAAPGVLGAAPDAMLFNGQASSDVKGPVRALAMDGGGKWGAVGVGDAPLAPGSLVLDDKELFVYNLRTENRAWEANDNDPVNEGARLVAVANGTGAAQGGDWLMLVNNTVPSVLTAYRTSGTGGVKQNDLVFQVNPRSGPINGLSLSADSSVFALATGDAANNKSVILTRSFFGTQPPRELFREQLGPNQANVTSFTSIAVNGNATVPDSATSTRNFYTVVGAQTVGTNNLVEGYVAVYQTNFENGVDTPRTTKVFQRDTSAPVTKVAITFDGEYAIAGTQDGQVFLVSVGPALLRKGSTGIEQQMLSTQQSVGARVTAVDIADFGGEFLAAGTDAGDVVLFQNRFDASGSVGAHARELGKLTASTTLCASPLRGSINTVDLTDSGEQLVAAAQNGILAVEVGAFARYGLPLEPAWCVPLSVDGNSIALADISGDGKTVFAAANHFAYGFKNTDRIALAVEDNVARRSSSPGSRVQFPITVRNDGSEFDRINLSAKGPLDPGWELALSNQSVLLMPGKSRTVLLNVTSPPSLAPGNFTITVEAQGDRGGLVGKQSLALRLDLGQLRRVEVRPRGGTEVVSVGIDNRIPIIIHNGGNAADTFRLEARIPDPQENFRSPGSEWTPRMEPLVIEVPGNSDATANLVVMPQGQRGDSATIEVSAASALLQPDDAGYVRDVKQVQVAVEPTYNGDISLLEAKEYRVEAGQVVYINFTVKNLGNTRDIFFLRNHTEPLNAPGWKLQFSDERFELRRTNEQKTVRLNAVAQLGLQPGESVKIVVDLFSDGDQKRGASGQVDSQQVTVTVIPKQKRGLPMAPEPVVLVAVALLALAAQRRRA
jgi:hypothetical protein